MVGPYFLDTTNSLSGIYSFSQYYCQIILFSVLWHVFTDTLVHPFCRLRLSVSLISRGPFRSHSTRRLTCRVPSFTSYVGALLRCFSHFSVPPSILVFLRPLNRTFRNRDLIYLGPYYTQTYSKILTKRKILIVKLLKHLVLNLLQSYFLLCKKVTRSVFVTLLLLSRDISK